MRYVYWLLAVGACAMSGLLGLTAGINENPASTVRFVPDWGSLADWVAGIGSLAAVVATFYFGWKQREDLLPKLRITTTGALVQLSGSAVPTFAVKFANTGSTPIELRGLVFHSDYSDQALWITDGMLLPASDSFNTMLMPGKGANVIFSRAALDALKEYVRNHCAGNTDGLKVTASGTVKDFTADVDPMIPRIK